MTLYNTHNRLCEIYEANLSPENYAKLKSFETAMNGLCSLAVTEKLGVWLTDGDAIFKTLRPHPVRLHTWICDYTNQHGRMEFSLPAWRLVDAELYTGELPTQEFFGKLDGQGQFYLI